MDTLPDLLADKLHILSIGLNPSLPSVNAGFYFANPRNRFWKALNGCGYFPETLQPSLNSCHHLLEQYAIGFTDLIKRPTAGCKDLNAADYRAGSIRLQALIETIQPQVIWFQGKLTCQKYLQYTSKKHAINWGLQSWRISDKLVFVSPNPSPANAAFSLQVITDSYQDLFQQVTETSSC